MDFEGSYEVLLRHKYFWSPHFGQEMMALFKLFEIGMETRFVLFSKWKKYYNLTFDGIFKFFCCTLC